MFAHILPARLLHVRDQQPHDSLTAQHSTAHSLKNTTVVGSCIRWYMTAIPPPQRQEEPGVQGTGVAQQSIRLILNVGVLLPLLGTHRTIRQCRTTRHSKCRHRKPQNRQPKRTTHRALPVLRHTLCPAAQQVANSQAVTAPHQHNSRAHGWLPSDR